MKKQIAFGAVFLALIAGPVLATPLTYEGSLDGGGARFGTVVGSGSTNCGVCGNGGIETLDFWGFSGTAGQVVTITGTRLDPNLDLAFAVFRGVLAGATPNDPVLPILFSLVDSSARSGQAIWVNGTSIGLGIPLAVGDDQLKPGTSTPCVVFAVPYCDPQVTLSLPVTGNYTVAVSAGIGSGTPVGTSSANYSLALAPGNLVISPEPSSYVLLGTGLAGLVAAARRRKSTT